MPKDTSKDDEYKYTEKNVTESRRYIWDKKTQSWVEKPKDRTRRTYITETNDKMEVY